MGRKSGIEGRRTPRRAFTRPIGVLRRGEYRVSQSVQLSEGGMLISTRVKMEAGDHIVITAIIHGGESLVVTAEVLYETKSSLSGAQYGIKFIDLPLHQRRMIRNYVSAKTLEEAELEVDEMKERKGA